MGTITESAKAFMPKLSEIRRDFHMHPEVSQHEERTGKKVAEYLKDSTKYMKMSADTV